MAARKPNRFCEPSLRGQVAGTPKKNRGRKNPSASGLVQIVPSTRRSGMWDVLVSGIHRVTKPTYRGALGYAKRIVVENREVLRLVENPSEYAAAAEASEEFHGIPAHESIEVRTKLFEHDTLADLGELVSLDVQSVNGGVVHLSKFSGSRLAQSPKGFPFQLFIEGGDQSVNLKEFQISSPHEIEVLGKLKRIVYFTDKKHLSKKDGGVANYRHTLGEVSGVRPLVIYDVMNKLLSIAGGSYKILPEGIDD